MPFPIRRRRLVLAAAAALLGSQPALAQDNKPLRLVVPFPPGGSTDLLARRLGEKLSASLNRPVVVENKPGAGGTVGADMVAKSAPDGSTLLVGVTGSNAIAGSLYPKLPYDPGKDFVPVSMAVASPLVLAVNASSPIRNVKDYIDAAKRGGVDYGTPGNGTSMHLTAEMFGLATGSKLVHVPYKGSGPAVNDLLGGSLQSMFGDFLVLLPHIKAGKLRPLAVTSSERHPMLPEVPTLAESGLPGLDKFQATSWQGIFAPAGTPPDVVSRLNAAVVKALESPDMKDFFGGQGFIVAGTTPAQARAFIDAEIPKWERVVKGAKVQVD
ncbi:tripartite tricarboxylate transporter substrate binding protein [Ramlibacter rhizophilus]|uniref:Tripartite tricarboxylate transporter substrate binding protein n=1 Tax=Ramlibacter rhizophilus TaxID=1781167 RepID=A0A4Z0BDM5_9BURK|nr:tripartite tricarboxylate transporter substrate binding protein [Ramlibacter rhizophilus]TFY96781.1 tripartite tricarboxylate transporter substrate binding protein [Ramlibacter rhizophilus]